MDQWRATEPQQPRGSRSYFQSLPSALQTACAHERAGRMHDHIRTFVGESKLTAQTVLHEQLLHAMCSLDKWRHSKRARHVKNTTQHNQKVDVVCRDRVKCNSLRHDCRELDPHHLERQEFQCVRSEKTTGGSFTYVLVETTEAAVRPRTCSPHTCTCACTSEIATPTGQYKDPRG
jgi:hypothetical protein